MPEAPFFGPFAVLVVPELAIHLDRTQTLPQCRAVPDGPPPESPPPGIPFVALATRETSFRHAQLTCSFWALPPAQRASVCQRLRDLADFIERAARPADILQAQDSESLEPGACPEPGS